MYWQLWQLLTHNDIHYVEGNNLSTSMLSFGKQVAKYVHLIDSNTILATFFIIQTKDVLMEIV